MPKTSDTEPSDAEPTIDSKIMDHEPRTEDAELELAVAEVCMGCSSDLVGGRCLNERCRWNKPSGVTPAGGDPRRDEDSPER